MISIGRPLSLLVLGAGLGLCGYALADDAACQTVLDAIVKQATIPVHQRISIESAAAPGRTLQSEMIRTGNTLYMQIRGQWTSRPYDGQKAATDARAAMQNAEHSCGRVRGESMLEAGGARSQHDVRFDYANVRAPAGVSH